MMFEGMCKKPMDVARFSHFQRALHPSGEYYQNIEEKNRRQAVTEAEIKNVLETSAIASSRWALKTPIISAIVAPFVNITKAKSLGVLVAISDGVYVPEKRR